MAITKGQRILQLIDIYADGIKGKFAKIFGVTPQNVSNWIKRDFIPYEDVYTHCEGLNLDWLFSGEGSPIGGDSAQRGELASPDLSMLVDRIEQQAKQIARLELMLEMEQQEHKTTKATLAAILKKGSEDLLIDTAGAVEDAETALAV